MSEKETALNYLLDLGMLIREAAIEAHQQSEEARANGNRDEFEMGRALAYYEVASMMSQQATTFGLAPVQIGFEDFNPDRDLLNASPDDETA